MLLIVHKTLQSARLANARCDSYIDSPLVTIEEFHERSGISISTIRKKIDASEFPTVDTRLDKDKRGAVYINMVKLTRLADSAEYLHRREGYRHPLSA